MMNLRFGFIGPEDTTLSCSEPRHRRKSRRKNEDVTQIVDVLRKVLDDTGHRQCVESREDPHHRRLQLGPRKRVSDFRRRHGIAAFSEIQKRNRNGSQVRKPLTHLASAAMSVTRLIKANVLPAEQPLTRTCRW